MLTHAGTPTHTDQERILRRMARATNYNAWLLDRARPFLGRRILDVGAGTGTFTEMIAEGREVVAAEPDLEFAKALEHRFVERPNVTVAAVEASGLGPEHVQAGFDSIVCFNVLEHVDDDATALEHFHRLLVPNGYLLLLVPAHGALFGPVDGLVGHQRRYEKRSLRRLLEHARFEVERLRYVNPVGAVGWLISGRVLGRADLPERSLLLYDRLVPLFRLLDRIELPFGLSLWAVARRDGE